MKEADDSHRGQSVAMQVLENVYRFGLGAIAGGRMIQPFSHFISHKGGL